MLSLRFNKSAFRLSVFLLLSPYTKFLSWLSLETISRDSFICLLYCRMVVSFSRNRKEMTKENK